MKLRYMMATVVALAASMAWAQVCPPSSGSVCLVPSQSATGYVTAAAPTGLGTTPTIVPLGTCPTTVQPGYSYQPGFAMQPGFAAVPMTCSPVQQAGACPYNVSPETQCLLNQISALRSDTFAMSLEMRGLQLTQRANQLIADEAIFRQSLAANPNMAGSQMMALRLSSEANALNRDIAAFNRELSTIPADQRPYLAARLNTFDTIYWTPTMASLQNFNTNFQQTASVGYQPAVAANPWLTNWQTSFQGSLNNLASTPQQYASARWWTQPQQIQVLGSTEMYPGTMGTMSGSIMVLPNGQAYFIPASSIPTLGSTTTLGTVGTTSVSPGQTTMYSPTMAY